MAPHKRSGFTLTELLVVITIIGVLMGLLLPAVMAARGRALVAQCTNNQKELGSAILQYEMAKQRFPGYANKIVSKKVSWIPVLFPYLGRNDLWEGNTKASPKILGWRTGTPTHSPDDNPKLQPPVTVKVRMAQLVCPDGSPGMVSPDTPLSYVVNVGPRFLTDQEKNDNVQEPGIFRNLCLTTATPVTQSNIKSSARRPMISERNYIINSTTDATRSWSATEAIASTSVVTPERLGFIWPATGIISSVLPSIHRGIVLVTFCDGHTESLADNTDCSAFDWQEIK